MLDAGIRLPAASGTYSITTTISVVQSNGSTRLLDTLHTSVSVRDAGDLVAPNATALQGLTLSSSSERATRDRLVAYLQQAGQQISAGTYEDAIGTLLKADDETRKISSVPMTTYRIAIADLIQIAESRWFGTRP
jgi:hypothetical protein